MNLCESSYLYSLVRFVFQVAFACIAGLEQLGHMADRQAGIVQAITEGNYRPNPSADTFSAGAQDKDRIRTK